MLHGEIKQAVEATLAVHREKVAAWRRNEPGSWGFLAGRAVLACRQRLGRSLTGEERRALWDLLWHRLLVEDAEQRAPGPGSCYC